MECVISFPFCCSHSTNSAPNASSARLLSVVYELSWSDISTEKNEKEQSLQKKKSSIYEIGSETRRIPA